MKITRLLFFLLSPLFFAGCEKDFDEKLRPTENPDTGTVPGVIRMKLDRDVAERLCVTRTRSGRLVTGDISFDELCERYRVTELTRLFDDNGCAERTRTAGLDLWYVVRFEGPADRIAADFGDTRGVDHVEIPRRIRRIGRIPAGKRTPTRSLLWLPQTVPADYPFDDPMFGEQWSLYNDGSIYSEARSGADINVLPAWRETAGRSDVIVAVVDEGVQYDHPDLAANMWSGIGKNFCSDTQTAITWGMGHGTHVAGTIAAVSNNGIGISGIAGGTGKGDGAKIMTCEIFHPNDAFYDAESDDTANAIKYAADNGAVICQNSWGYEAGSFRSESDWINSDRAVKEAIDYFIRYAGMSPDGTTQTGPMAGGVVIFAAGNEYSGKAAYPAAYDACISVASIACDFEAAWYSNYGPTVDICAPGGGDAANFKYYIGYDEGYNLSTIPTDLKNGDRFAYTSFFGQTEYEEIDYVSATPGYGYMQGTSMACPHVSGVAALIVSKFGAPGFTNTRLKEMLLSTARDIDGYQGRIYRGTGTYAGQIGRLVDAGAALNAAPELPGGETPTITPAAGQEDTFVLNATESKTLKYTLANYRSWSLTDDTGNIEASVANDVVSLVIRAEKYEAGTYTATLQADNQSRTSSYTVAYTIRPAEGIEPDPVRPSIDPASGQEDTFTLTNDQVRTLRYTLSDYTDWYLDDPTEKIEKTLSGDEVSLRIDGARYDAGSYTAELCAVNGDATVRRRIAYTVVASENPGPEPAPQPQTIEMDFYPNPCVDVLNILANASGEGILRLRNSTGREVMNRKIVFVANRPLRIDVSHLSSGIYRLETCCGDTTIASTIVKR